MEKYSFSMNPSTSKPNIKNLSKSEIFLEYLPTDKNGRKIDIFLLKNAQTVGDNYYPNLLLKNKKGLYRPINEKVMSLGEIEINNLEFENNKVSEVEKNPVFFFIYNTDNYYHFIYDTLPYLISYFHLKSLVPNLKLLMNYPNPEKSDFYRFVKEFLEILDIIDDDILIIKGDTIYEQVYISTSYTHGLDSNKPPRNEVYGFYKKIVSLANRITRPTITEYPKKIYISRRTWQGSDTTNIGTNYTTRRRMINEDELVEYLTSKGFSEIFTENLSTIDKINLFHNAESIVGAIGGGLCNVLFSKNAELLVLVSPTFLEVNSRFKYSFVNTNTNYFFSTEHSEKDKWKKYMRVRTKDNLIGEIQEIYDESLLISYTKKFVTGWNNEVEFDRMVVEKKDCHQLDNGLNSPWFVNLEELKNKV
jgi:capsular polysaccharide biosynthesis protein